MHKAQTAARAAAAAAVLGGAALGAYKTVDSVLFNVEAGHRALKFSRVSGLGETIYEEGTHVMLPWIERAVIYDCRAQPKAVKSMTGSRDLQTVQIQLRSLVRPNATQLPELYRTLGMDYIDKVLPSITNEVLKSVVAQFNASQLITQRELVSQAMRRELVKRAREFHIELDDVAITHLSFSREYERAVESKQVAHQEAERAKYWVLKAEDEKKNIIVKAQGEMEAAKMIGNAIKNNPGFIELRRIEAAREVAGTLGTGSNRVMLDASSLMLDLMAGSSSGRTGPGPPQK